MTVEAEVAREVEDAELEVAVMAREVEDAEDVSVGVAGEQCEPRQRLCTGPCKRMSPALVVAITLRHTLHSTITLIRKLLGLLSSNLGKGVTKWTQTTLSIQIQLALRYKEPMNWLKQTEDVSISLATEAYFLYIDIIISFAI